jgi:site-specific recombinase XerD
MTIHFYLERKSLKTKEKSIYCYIRGIQKGKTIILNTSQKIEKQFWDAENEKAHDRGNRKYSGSKELNDLLSVFKEEVKKSVRIFLTDNPTAEYESIRQTILERFGRVRKNQLSFFEALSLFKETRKKDLSPDSIRKFNTLEKHLKEFEQKEHTQLIFAQLDLLFYDKFFAFLIGDKKMINNSAYKIIGLLKIFLNWAYDRGLNNTVAFRKFKLKEEQTDIITLNESEIDKLNALDLSDNKRLERARDLFLFGCYTGGRFLDLTKVTHEDFKEGFWYLRVNKTRDVLEIPLADTVLRILDKYKSDIYPLPRLSNQKLNVYIKEVCKLAGVEEIVKIVQYRGSEAIEFVEPKYMFVSSHTARRTFITQSLLRGMKAEIVMGISGHKNFKTFKKYIDITRTDKEEELKKAWNDRKLRVVNFENKK